MSVKEYVVHWYNVDWLEIEFDEKYAYQKRVDSDDIKSRTTDEPLEPCHSKSTERTTCNLVYS